MIEIVEALLRAAMLLACGSHAGLSLHLVCTRARDEGWYPAWAKALTRSAIASMTLSFAWLLWQPVRYAGNFADAFATDWLWLAASTEPGRATALRLAALALLATATTAIALRRPLRSPLISLVALALTAASFALTGHTHDESVTASGLPLSLALHIGLLSMWGGALLGLQLQHAAHGNAVFIGRTTTFSRLASLWFPVALGSGAWMAWMLMGRWPDTTRAYDLLFLVKLLLVAVVLSLVANNRWRILPRLQHPDASAVIAMRHSIRYELIALSIIAMLTVAMTTWTSPY